MPAKVKVKIIAGKNLPVMDRSSDTTDAYVELKLGGTTYKTEVCRKSLNPQWNSDWYRFEMDDSELQDEPLQIRLMDHDTYSANDAIGKVYVDLNPLLLPSIPVMPKCRWSGDPSSNGEHSTNSLLSGWFPVYDTMHGIRGEVNVMVKVELFSDFNKFRQSSCGVQFFCSPSVPHGYAIQMYHGFVEELIVNDDPEYQWIDKIRTPRASNEARQTLFFKLAGELRRRIGVKALELGGNAVIGYSQCFDLEGELGVVVRGIGTSVTLTKLRDVPPLTILESNNEEHALDNLQFLRCDKGFHLDRSYPNNIINNNSVLSPNSFYSSQASELTYPGIKQKKTLSRHLSYNEFTTMKSTLSLNQNVFGTTKDHSSSLQTLLRQEDLRGVPAKSIAQTFKNFKYSSQNLLSKKMTALKAKLSDSEMQEEDHDGEHRPGARKKRTLFHSQSSNDSNPLAELLVHSIMHSSLERIGNEGDSWCEPENLDQISNDSSTTSSSSDEDETASSNVNYDTVSNIIKNLNTVPDVEKLAPLATGESFDIDEHSSCHFTIGTEGNDSESGDSSLKSEFFMKESIIPSVHMTDDAIERQSLTETAMKVMLLDKVQLMGTYTPPSSPKCATKKIKFMPDLSDSNSSSHIPSVHLFKRPVNAELDKGSNNMHASLAHSPRTIISPGTELSKCDSGHHRTESVSGKISQSPGKFQSIPFMNRRSSDSDLSITPKGNSLTGSDKSSGLHNAYISRIAPMVHTSIPQNNFDMLEYPFMTIYKFPPGFVMYLGGVVSARSVKLLERITNLEEPESRDTWWTELRMEIRSHMRSLHCNAVLAYSETSSISDDVCVLSASGTAAVIRFYSPEEMAEGLSSLPGGSRHTSGNKDVMASSLERNDFERERIHQKQDLGFNSKPLPESPENETVPNHTSINTISPCSICHLPYINNSVPLRTISSKCAFCRFGKVPDVLMATIEIPESVPSVGRGCFVQAYVCRPLKDLRSELNAKDISDGLPFLEYELHRILVNKIRIKGMNAVFGLRIRISVGTKMLVGIATGTAMFLLPLPSPPLPKLVSIGSIDEKQLTKMQQHLYDTIQANKEIYHLKTNEHLLNSRLSPDDEHPQEEEQSFLDLSTENRDCCILEVEDSEDKEIMELLREPPPPDGFHVINTEVIPGLDEMEVIKNLQMFTQIWRSKIYPSYNFGLHISKLLQSVYFKLRRMVPCALCNLKFRIDLPEPDEIQLTVLGMALELRKSVKPRKKNIHTSLRESTQITTEEDMMFNLEEDPADCNSLSVQPAKSRTRSPFRSAPIASNVALPREKRSIDITQLSYVPGGKIERYLGNLNFFFIRETTSIREEGGLSGFIHTFVTEVLAIVRAHIAALGGNAMVAYYMTECDFSHSVHKNQGQCLINVGGDVVFVSYYAEK
ncbi:hypothetical protein PPYR_05422 [Photinus pyralis]|uniref:C2 domain-containing protein n=2 Tax=Photinus pyralis TaxID=7054 RepID=A0A1Y1LLK1_PHOPY|nr:C2 domain-containing protein 5 isoform X2 [Photinus pyralis]KAB0801068.1 hypothetical protein PPYR_05422 [Photinus pyralis]